MNLKPRFSQSICLLRRPHPNLNFTRTQQITVRLKTDFRENVRKAGLRSVEMMKKNWTLSGPFRRKSAEIIKKGSTTFMTDPSWNQSRNWLFTAGLVLAGTFSYYISFSPKAVDNNLLKAFEKGNTFVKNDLPRDLVPREDLINQLMSDLRPSSPKFYALIVGEHGTGKTTLIAQAILRLEKPKGVIHFECPEYVQHFATQLVAFLDCDINSVEHNAKEPYRTWYGLREMLKRTAYDFWKKHNRPMVLVLDQVDRIAKQDPKFLEDLQEFAKSCADSGKFIIIFVSSEGIALDLMRSRSAWSRAIILREIGDISDSSAVKFLKGVLVKKPDEKDDEKISGAVEDAVKYLTGGRLVLLQQVITLNASSESNDDILNVLKEFQKDLFAQVDEVLRKIKVPEDHEFFKMLLEVQRITFKEATTKMPRDMLSRLIETNILSKDEYRTLTFHSRYVETYFKKALNAKILRDKEI